MLHSQLFVNQADVSATQMFRHDRAVKEKATMLSWSTEEVSVYCSKTVGDKNEIIVWSVFIDDHHECGA